MARVTELYVREDWGFVKFAYLPALALGFFMSKWLPLLAVVTIRINPCFLCVLVSRWGHHLEEFYHGKPMLQITGQGLRFEDGCEPLDCDWHAITGVVMHRRNPVPPWRTGGSAAIAPPYWLAISVRDPESEPANGAVFREGESYAERSRRPAGGGEVENEGERLIAVWPRQVEGGLLRLMRFATELRRELVERCERLEIPCLISQEPDSTQQCAP